MYEYISLHVWIFVPNMFGTQYCSKNVLRSGRSPNQAVPLGMFFNIYIRLFVCILLSKIFDYLNIFDGNWSMYRLNKEDAIKVLFSFLAELLLCYLTGNFWGVEILCRWRADDTRVRFNWQIFLSLNSAKTFRENSSIVLIVMYGFYFPLHVWIFVPHMFGTQYCSKNVIRSGRSPNQAVPLGMFFNI